MSNPLTVACVAALATASGASGAEILLVASAPTAAVQYVTAEEKAIAAQFFDAYDAATRRELEKVARYPDKAATYNQRLKGSVGVAFEINSNGDVQRAEVIQSSRSKTLDSTALASVRWAKYPAFAAAVPSIELTRRYTVTFDYQPPVE